MGLVTALKFQPYQGSITIENGREEGSMIVMAVGNGKQCGGGYQVTPEAAADDGKLDLIVIHDVEIAQLGAVFSELSELQNPANSYVSYRQATSFVIETDEPFQMNLDGEPLRDTRFEFGILPAALPFVIPDDSPLLAANATQQNSRP